MLGAQCSVCWISFSHKFYKWLEHWTLNSQKNKYCLRKDARGPRLETQRISLHTVNYLAKITLPFHVSQFNKIYLGYALFGLRLVFSEHVSFHCRQCLNEIRCQHKHSHSYWLAVEGILFGLWYDIRSGDRFMLNVYNFNIFIMATSFR